MKGIAILHTIVTRSLMIGIVMLYFVPFCCILLMPFGSRLKSKIVFKIVHSFYWLSLRSTFLPVRFENLENVPAQQSIIVANHQSSLDIPILGQVARANSHVWLARAELMESWVLQFVLPLLAIIADVTSMRAAVTSLRKVLAVLQQYPCHLMIFPEGSRFKDGQIHPFFNGFAIIAQKTGLPVVPVYIKGVNKIYPRSSFLIHYHPVTITVGKPMLFDATDSLESFNERVRAWFIEQNKYDEKGEKK